MNVPQALVNFKRRLKFRRRLKFYMCRVQCALAGSPLYSFELADGCRFEYPLKSEVGRALFLGVFETREVEFIRKQLQAGDVFLDIGANAGFYTIIASKIVGSSGHIYAFEPGIAELEMLRRNIANNNLTNVTIVERAVSNEKGTAKFFISNDGAMNSLAKTNHPEQIVKGFQTVETTTLDDFIKDFGLSQVNFIKIDVEGAEHLVFEGAKQFIADRQGNLPPILFECTNLTSSGFGYEANDFLQKLSGSGLRISVIDEQLNLTAVADYQQPEEIGGKIYNFVATA
jgi:FkbM family methyltransferase